MTDFNRRTVLGMGAAAATVGLTGTARADTFVRVGGGLAGTLPIFAAKLVELINANVEGVTANVVSGDIETSLVAMQQGELTINNVPSFQSYQVSQGKGSLGVATPDIRHIITLYGSPIQPIAALGGPERLADAAKKPYRIWMGSKSGFFAQVFEPILEATGVSLADIEAAGGIIERYGYLDEVQGFQDGKLDLGIFAGPVPYGLMMQIQDNPGFRLLGLTEDEVAKLEALRPGMGRMNVPAGSYKGQDKDVLLPFYVNHLVSNVNVSDDLIYQVTKIMYEQHTAFHGLFNGSEEIDDKDVLKYNALPVHPGAERFYKEVGVM
jgi:uncharacterized protein